MKTRGTKIVAKRINPVLLIGVLLIVSAVIAVPFYSVNARWGSSSQKTAAPAARTVDGNLSTRATRLSSAMNTSLATPFAPFFTPAIAIYQSDCTTPSTSFSLGDTVCAKITGANLPVDGRTQSRIGWVSPYGSLAQGGDITTDPQTGTYAIPATAFQTFTDSGGGTVTVDNRGTWTLGIYSGVDASFITGARFTVHDPAVPSVDLNIHQSLTPETTQVSAGSNGLFQIFVNNFGPDAAQAVVLNDNTPANTTFVSFTQTSGPAFTCTTPAEGETGAINCTLASFAADGSASFVFTYKVNEGTAGGTVISNTATIASTTVEAAPSDNSSTQEVNVPTSGGGNANCTVNCPDDITTNANTTDGDGNPGAVVTYPAPTGDAACGTITTSHCNNCFFPVGTTVVTASSDSGDSCSFTVTVRDAGAPVITCPSDKTANADNDCQAVVAVGTATATGGNVTVFGTRSDGLPMYDCDANGNCTRRSSDAPFPAGTTTISWVAYSHDVAGPYTTPGPNEGDTFEEQHRTGSASCTQAVIVNDVTAPVIGATDQTVSADANCQAAVPDYSSTVSDNCACSSSDTSDACAGHPHFTVTQSPAPGTLVGPGAHTVHIEANDGSSNNGGLGNTSTKDVVFTVNDTTAPVITSCPPSQTVNSEPGTCAAHVVTGTATATDNCDSSVTITGTRSDGRPLTDTYPKGTTTITWKATDDAGNYSECTQTITVEDHEAPTITFNGQTPSMWPPNHSYQTFTAASFISSVSDNCDSLSVSDVQIISATSDEVEDGAGDGNTLNDIVIAADCKSIQVRAERQNNGNGRVYTITFRLKDSSGNFTTGTAKVYSPKNEGEIPGDDGPHYSVTGSCP